MTELRRGLDLHLTRVLSRELSRDFGRLLKPTFRFKFSAVVN
jgi:hypothetical protein